MTKPPHLVFVVNDPAFFLSHRLPLAVEARRRGYRVTLVSPAAPCVSTLHRYEIQHVIWELSRWGMHPVAELRSVLALRSILVQLDPTIVHNVTIKPVLYASLISQFLKRQPLVVNAISGLGYIFISTGTWAAMRRWIVIWFYRIAFRGKTTQVIFQNQEDLSVFLRHRITSAPQAHLISGSGVDPHRYAPRAKSPAENAARPMVLFPARILSDKGVYEFVGAAKLLRSAGVDAQFVLAGEAVPGNPAGVPEHVIHSWVSAGLVAWWGFQSDMPATFQRSAVVVLPSYREGFPKALVEAAACGIPVVTTDTPGCRDAVLPNVTGLLVPVRDVSALAQAIKTLLLNPTLRLEFGRAGREFFENSQLTEEKVIQKTFAVYEKLPQD